MLLLFCITGVKKLIYIHKFNEADGSKQSGKTNSLADLGTDLLALVESDKPSPTPASPKPLTPKPAAPLTQDAQKKAPVEDDTLSLTELEKQAEMEVNSLTTKKKDKGRVTSITVFLFKRRFLKNSLELENSRVGFALCFDMKVLLYISI